MSDLYHQLLEASIQHLQDLQARGVRFVSVSQQTLNALSEQSRPTPKSVAKPFHQPEESVTRERKGLLSSRGIERDDTAAAPGDVMAAPPAKALSPEAKAAAFADLR